MPPRYSVFRVDSSGANRARAAAYVLSARLDEQSPSFIFYCISHLVFVNVFEYVFVFEALIVGLYQYIYTLGHPGSYPLYQCNWSSQKEKSF